MVVIALNVTSIALSDEPVAAESTGKTNASSTARSSVWPALERRMAAPSPFARVESPTAVVNGKLYLFGGFTEDLQASNQIDAADPVRYFRFENGDVRRHWQQSAPHLS